MKFIHVSALYVITFFACNLAWADADITEELVADQDNFASASEYQPEVDNPIRAAQQNERDMLFAIQTVLRTLLVYSGPIDGHLGAPDRRAIRRFEENEGLPVDGELSETELELLALRFDQMTEHGSVWAALDCPGPGCPSQPYADLQRPFRMAAPVPAARTLSPRPASPSDILPPVASPSILPGRTSASRPVFDSTTLLPPRPPWSSFPAASIAPADPDATLPNFHFSPAISLLYLDGSLDQISDLTVPAMRCALWDLGYLQEQALSHRVDGEFLSATSQFAQENEIDVKMRNPFDPTLLRTLIRKYEDLEEPRQCGVQAGIKRGPVDLNVFR